MFDENLELSVKISDAVKKVSNCAFDILYNSDGSNSSVIEDFNDKFIYYKVLTSCMLDINKKVDGFTDNINKVLVDNSINEKAFTSYGFRVNGQNPLFDFPNSNYSDAVGLNNMLNSYQEQKNKMFVHVVNSVHNYSINLINELVAACMKRKVMKVRLDNYATAEKIVEYTAAGTAAAAGAAGVASAIPGAATAASAALTDYAQVLTGQHINALLYEAYLANAAGTAASSTALAPIAAGTTEVAVVGTTELAAATATGGVAEVVGGSTAAATASTGFFASALTAAGLGVAGAAIVLAPLAYKVVKVTKKRVDAFANAIDELGSLITQYYNSFYCKVLNYNNLKFDDSNPLPITTNVFKKDVLLLAHNSLNLSLSDSGGYTGLGFVKMCGKLKDFVTKLNDSTVNNLIDDFCYLNSNSVSFQGILKYSNNILGNISLIIKMFEEAEGNVVSYTGSISKDEIVKQVINGNWGNGAERKARLEAAGYNYDEIQSRVNELLLGTGATITTGTTSVVANISNNVSTNHPTTQYRVQDLGDSVDLATARKEYLEKLEKAQKESDAKIAKLKEQQQKEIENFNNQTNIT